MNGLQTIKPTYEYSLTKMVWHNNNSECLIFHESVAKFCVTGTKTSCVLFAKLQKLVEIQLEPCPPEAKSRFYNAIKQHTPSIEWGLLHR